MHDNCSYEASYESGGTPEDAGTSNARRPRTSRPAVHEDTRQALIGKSSIADNTRARLRRRAPERPGRRDSPGPPGRRHASPITWPRSTRRRQVAPATITLVVAAIQFRAKIAGTRSPVGEVARRTLAGIRKEGRERGRGQATSGHL